MVGGEINSSKILAVDSDDYVTRSVIHDRMNPDGSLVSPRVGIAGLILTPRENGDEVECRSSGYDRGSKYELTAQDSPIREKIQCVTPSGTHCRFLSPSAHHTSSKFFFC